VADRPQEWGAGAEDPFAVLGIAPEADDAAVRLAYRAAVRAHPPETDPEGFKRVRAAFEAVRDPAERARTVSVRLPWLGELPLPVPEELGGTPPQPPGPVAIAAALRALALAETDLARSEFRSDLRDPPPPPWA
jgi:hypothetical protein